MNFSFLKDKYLRKLFVLFEKYDEKLYVVGGAVRDSLIDKPITDIDLATTMLPEKMMEMFQVNELRHDGPGIKFGTVRSFFGGDKFEITTLRKDKYENVSTFIEILNNIKKNGRVIKQLKSGVSILNSFLYKNVDIKINNIVDIELSSKQYGIYDYSFLIMNFVKAVEVFLTYKLSKFDGKINVYNKEIRKNQLVELSSDVFKKYSMLGDMINYLDDHSGELFNQEFDQQIIKRFLLLIKDWKDKDRNGYFHKHRIENIDDALNIILSSLQIIVGIELYLNNKN